MSPLSSKDGISRVVNGLKERNINFITSENALGCQVTEIYIIDAKELILFPIAHLDSSALRWILEIRTPLRVRLTFFTHEMKELKIQLMQAISSLNAEGLQISENENAISVLELSESNIHRLLEALENWGVSREYGSPMHLIQTNESSINYSKSNVGSTFNEKYESLLQHLRNAIKTYWTERYFARYLNVSSEYINEFSKRFGIQHEVCGQDTIYFFDKTKALETYFMHIMKGIFNELDLQYQNNSRNYFFIPNLHLGLFLFDDETGLPSLLIEQSGKKQDLIIIVPETISSKIEHLGELLFPVLPLDKEKIKKTLRRITRQRIEYIAAYSSGVTH